MTTRKTAKATADREALKTYLQQYNVAKRGKVILEDRHRELMADLRAPARGSSYHSTPASRTVKTDCAVSVVFRIAEVEDRIEGQRDEMAKAVLRVMDLIDLLPSNSMERTVIELRHIDGKRWEQIAKEVYLSRSAVIKHYNAGLDRLLGYERAKTLVVEYSVAQKENPRA